MRALIYTRVSLDRGGRSTTEQEAELRTWATREGWTITHVITETGSASRYARSTRARTRWPDLVTALATGTYDILLTWEGSRATRQLDEYAQLRTLCETHDVLWGYGGRVYDLTDRHDRRTTGQDMLDAEDESARTSERVLRNVRARAAEGRPHGKLPYGYRREYDPATGHLQRQVPHEDQAPVVPEIYTRILDGDSIRNIAADLSRRDITPPRPPTTRTDRKQAWLGITVRRIALSPTYAARRTHKGIVVGPATWEPLVDDHTWEKATAILNDPTRHTRTGDSTARHLLTGIATCGKPHPDGTCGAELRLLRNRGRYPTYLCHTPHCYGVAIAAHLLDDHVRDVIVALLHEHRDALTAIDTPHGHDPALTQARAHLQDLRDRLAGFVAEATAGHLSPATLVTVEAGLLPQIAAAEQDVRHLLIPRALKHIDLTDPATSWDAMTIPDQRRTIRDLVTVTVLPAGKGNRGHRGLDENRVRIRPAW